MKNIVLLLTLLFGFLNNAQATGVNDWNQFISENTGKAQLYQNNSEALQARLALLQAAPAGSRVKIATFVFDYGEVVENLAAHICDATRSVRGVHVELLVDSKSGDQLDKNGPFDTTKDMKKVEELYQHMANCGAHVYIHNSFTDYNEISAFMIGTGNYIPNVFTAEDANGSKVSALQALGRIKALKAHLQQVMKSKGYDLKLVSFINRLQNFTLALSHLTSMAGRYADNKNLEREESPEASIEGLRKSFHKLITDPLVAKTDVETFGNLAEDIKKSIFSDPLLNQIREKIRLYNRLNHRKLFMVELPNGKACGFIGGRNLGDHYLANHEDSFHDGDVMTCGNLQEGSLMDQMAQSFEELKTDRKDPLMTGNLNNIRKVEINHHYKFDKLKLSHLVLKSATFPQGKVFADFADAKLLTSGWDPRGDDIHFQMLRAIKREQKEIYIETAYAELNSSLRRALEDALARNVSVHIVTNGYFISDGMSGMIRIAMAHWNEVMKKRYPKLFNIEFATLQSKHMIHFKGAGFRCQKRGDQVYRTYFMGSHNFHQRSGFSDKEHMINWNESTDGDCSTPSHDLISYRNEYYGKTAGERARYIKTYYNPKYPEFSSLYFELLEVTRNHNDEKHSTIARGLIRTFYSVTATKKITKTMLGDITLL